MGRFIVPIADLSAPTGINLRHRSRIPEGGWADEQKVHVVKWDVPFLSPHSLRSGQTLSAAKGLSDCAERCIAAHSMTDPSTITLSEAKGLSHWASRCIAAHSMTEFPCHPERSEGSVAPQQ